MIPRGAQTSRIRTTPYFGGQSESPTGTRDVADLHVGHVVPRILMATLNVRCHSVQVRSDPKAKYNSQRIHIHEIVHLLHLPLSSLISFERAHSDKVDIFSGCRLVDTAHPVVFAFLSIFHHCFKMHSQNAFL